MTATMTARTRTNDDARFLSWRSELERLCQERWGLGLDDLPEFDERAAFEAGISAIDFFEEEVLRVMRDELERLRELAED